MRTRKQRFISALLAVAMMFVMMPVGAVGAFAADDDSTTVSYPDAASQLMFSVKDGKASITGMAESNNSTIINIPTSVTNDGRTYSVTAIADSAFSYNENITSVSIPLTVETIGEKAFYNCSALTSVTLYEGLKTIGRYAFYGCSKLTSIDLPDSLNKLDRYAFAYSGITSLTLPGSLTEMSLACKNMKDLTSVTFKEGSTTVGSDMFEGCNKLSSVTLADTIETIQGQAFDGCNNISFDKIILPSNLKSIGGLAFRNCTALTSVDFSKTNAFASIGNSAFIGCSKLSDISLPDTLTTIGDYAFSECTALDSVKIPAGITSFGKHAFFDSGLTSVTLPEGLTTLGESAFRKTKITSVTIPSTVKTIPASAFAYCSNLTSVTLKEDLETIGGSAFQSAKITSLEIPSTVRSIGDAAFFSCSNLSSVTFTPSVGNSVSLSIEGSAFSNDSKLKELILPKRTTSVGASAFGGYNIDSKTIRYDGHKADLDTLLSNSNANAFSYYNTSSVLSTYDVLYRCDVTFNSNGGTDVPAQTDLWKNSTLSDLPVPTKEGFVFNGWYLAGSTDKFTSETPISDDIVLDADWTSAKTKIIIPSDVKVEVCTPDTEPYFNPLFPSVDASGKKYIEVDNGTRVLLTIDGSVYDGTYNYTWSGGNGDPSSNGKSYTFTVNGDAEITYTKEASNRKKIYIPKGVDCAVKGPSSSGTDDSGAYIITAVGTEITLRVSAPQKDSTYTWKNKTASDETETTSTGESYTFTVEDNATITLTETKKTTDDTTKPDDGKGDDTEDTTPKHPLDLDGAELVSVKDAKGNDIKSTLTKNADGSYNIPVGSVVTIKPANKDTLADSGSVFDHWDVTVTGSTLYEEDGKTEVDTKKEQLTFVMPAKDVTIKVMTRDASIEDDSSSILGTIAIGATVVAGGAVLGYQAYRLGTEFWLNYHLPAWAVIPETRIQLAELLWKDADQPAPAEPAAYSDIDADNTDAQQAAQWAVENNLIALPDKEDTTRFDPDTHVSRIAVIKAWKKAQELKNN